MKRSAAHACSVNHTHTHTQSVTDIVMSVVVYPYVEFYEQQKKLTDLLNTYCPRLMEQLRTLPGVVQNLSAYVNIM